MRREFFPEVDAGAFEVYVRAPSGTRIEATEQRVKEVEDFIRERLGTDLQLVISEIGVVPDLSAAYTPNAGPMDAVVKVQLIDERERTAQQYVQSLRNELAADRRFADLEFAYDAGGMIRAAMNQGKSSPINVRVTGKDPLKGRAIAEAIRRRVASIANVVDARIIQRLDYPQYIIDVDRAKAADLGLSQSEVMKNVVAALNSSITFHKKNFWIDPVSKNQYFVGVQYFEEDIDSIQTLMDVPITSPKQSQPIPLRNIATLRRGTVPTEITHNNLLATMDLTLGVQGRDLGHVADDVAGVIGEFGIRQNDGTWFPFDPTVGSARREPMKGAMIELSGEYSRMQETFPRALGIGLILAVVLIYFLMAALVRSYVVPLTASCWSSRSVLSGVLPMLYVTGTGAERPVAARDHLHRGHQGLEHGPDDRLCPGPAPGGGAVADRGDSQGGLGPRPTRDDDGARRLLRHDPDGPRPGTRERGQCPARSGDPGRTPGRRAGDSVRPPGALFLDGSGPESLFERFARDRDRGLIPERAPTRALWSYGIRIRLSGDPPRGGSGVPR